MADDSIKTKKVTDLGENTSLTDEDLFIIGSSGSAALRRVKWKNILTDIGNTIKAKLSEWTFPTLDNKTIPGMVNELNTKLSKTDLMDADYVTGGIDTTINKYADTTGVIFGHSDALNEKCGFWVFVLTMGVKNAGHYAQLAIGSLGHASREYSPDTGWSTWV